MLTVPASIAAALAKLALPLSLSGRSGRLLLAGGLVLAMLTVAGLATLKVIRWHERAIAQAAHAAEEGVTSELLRSANALRERHHGHVTLLEREINLLREDVEKQRREEAARREAEPSTAPKDDQKLVLPRSLVREMNR